MSDFFKDKVVAVTGGSEGIGKALVDQLLGRGAKVATCARDHDRLYQLQAQYASYPLHTMVADVSNENDCRHFVESTVEGFGGIDVLINNAGITMRSLVQDSSVDVLQQIMDVNFYGSVYCTRLALPSLLQRRGVVAGISSIAGCRGLPGRSAYSASKFALQGWLEALRTELLDSGVHVMWICPGFVATNIRNVALDKDARPKSGSVMDEGRMMTADECAGHILGAIEKKKRSEVLTFKGKQTVFLNKFFPALADRLVHKFFFKNGKLIK
ncbi:SDR family oxidoreductase [Paraflavisolibacter sp. H34]|uniref:SDR family oxidoreductase n=1 Tax=Huijunlia imazamoxiresistens TaxID=3127457 RepID=UPI003017A71D